MFCFLASLQIVFFLLSICGFCTIASAIWEAIVGYKFQVSVDATKYDNPHTSTLSFQIYLPWENIIPKDYLQGATIIGCLVFFSYAIVLNTVVPISLYVSVEVGTILFHAHGQSENQPAFYSR